MFKKRIVCFALTAYLMTSALPVFAGNTNTAKVFDKSELGSGVISVRYDNTTNVKRKLMVQKGDKTYYYNLQPEDQFPLQFGNGEYTVAVLENVKDNKYKLVAKETFWLELENPNEVFLKSMKLVRWNDEMEAIKKAKELTKDAKTDNEKIMAIYNYMIHNVSYDYDKIARINTDYVPVIDETLATETGICYDFASLFAAMLRSVDIPTKLVMGYKNNIDVYHAWNQVYLQATDEWVTVDTTYDSILYHSGEEAFSWNKDAQEYTVEKLY